MAARRERGAAQQVVHAVQVGGLAVQRRLPARVAAGRSAPAPPAGGRLRRPPRARARRLTIRARARAARAGLAPRPGQRRAGDHGAPAVEARLEHRVELGVLARHHPLGVHHARPRQRAAALRRRAGRARRRRSGSDGLRTGGSSGSWAMSVTLSRRNAGSARRGEPGAGGRDVGGGRRPAPPAARACRSASRPAGPSCGRRRAPSACRCSARSGDGPERPLDARRSGWAAATGGTRSPGVEGCVACAVVIAGVAPMPALNRSPATSATASTAKAGRRKPPAQPRGQQRQRQRP